MFNRGINHQLVFFTDANYLFFLQLVDKYLLDYVHILAYCLLPNHFHLILKVKDEVLHGESIHQSEEEVGRITSNQIRKLFITYTMAINRQEERSGGLFVSKYKRLEIEDDDYLRYAIFYVHHNPEKHGYEADFRKYRFSSYKALFVEMPTKTDRELVWEIFGRKKEFIDYHNCLREEKDEVIME